MAVGGVGGGFQPITPGMVPPSGVTTEAPNQAFEELLNNAITGQGFALAEGDARQLQELIQGFSQQGKTIDDFASTTLSTSLGDVALGDLNYEKLVQAMLQVIDGADPAQLRSFFQIPTPTAAPTSLAVEGTDVTGVSTTAEKEARSQHDTRNVVKSDGFELLGVTDNSLQPQDAQLELPLFSNPNAMNLGYGNPTSTAPTLLNFPQLDAGFGYSAAPLSTTGSLYGGVLGLDLNLDNLFGSTAASPVDTFPMSPASSYNPFDPFAGYGTFPSMMSYGSGYSPQETIGYKGTTVDLNWTGGPDFNDLETQAYDQLRASSLNISAVEMDDVFDQFIHDALVRDHGFPEDHTITDPASARADRVALLEANGITFNTEEMNTIDARLAEIGEFPSDPELKKERIALLDQRDTLTFARVNELTSSLASEIVEINTRLAEIGEDPTDEALIAERAALLENKTALNASRNAAFEIETLDKFSSTYMRDGKYGTKGIDTVRHHMHSLAAYSQAGGAVLAYEGNQANILAELTAFNESSKALMTELTMTNLISPESLETTSGIMTDLQTLEQRVSTLNQYTNGSINPPQDFNQFITQYDESQGTAQSNLLTYTSQSADLLTMIENRVASEPDIYDQVDTTKARAILDQLQGLPASPVTAKHQELLTAFKNELGIIADGQSSSVNPSAHVIYGDFMADDPYQTNPVADAYFDVLGQASITASTVNEAVTNHVLINASLSDAENNFTSLIHSTQSEIDQIRNAEGFDETNPQTQAKLEQLSDQLSALTAAQAQLQEVMGVVNSGKSMPDEMEGFLNKVLPNSNDRVALQREFVTSKFDGIRNVLKNEDGTDNQRIEALRTALVNNSPPFDTMDQNVKNNLLAVLNDPEGFTNDVEAMLLDENLDPANKVYLESMMTGIQSLIISVNNAPSDSPQDMFNTMNQIGSQNVAGFNDVSIYNSIIDANFLRLEYATPSSSSQSMVNEPGNWINTIFATASVIESEEGVSAITDRGRLLNLVEQRLSQPEIGADGEEIRPALMTGNGHVFTDQLRIGDKALLDAHNQVFSAVNADQQKLVQMQADLEAIKGLQASINSLPPSDRALRAAMEGQLHALEQATFAKYDVSSTQGLQDKINSLKTSIQNQKNAIDEGAKTKFDNAMSQAQGRELNNIPADFQASYQDMLSRIQEAGSGGVTNYASAGQGLSTIEVLNSFYSNLGNVPEDQRAALQQEFLTSVIQGQAGSSADITERYRAFLRENGSALQLDPSEADRIKTVIATEIRTLSSSADLAGDQEAHDENETDENYVSLGRQYVVQGIHEVGSLTLEGVGFLSQGTGSDPAGETTPLPPPHVGNFGRLMSLWTNRDTQGDDAGLTETQQENAGRMQLPSSIQNEDGSPMSLIEFLSSPPSFIDQHLQSMNPAEFTGFLERMESATGGPTDFQAQLRRRYLLLKGDEIRDNVQNGRLEPVPAWVNEMDDEMARDLESILADDGDPRVAEIAFNTARAEAFIAQVQADPTMLEDDDVRSRIIELNVNAGGTNYDLNLSASVQQTLTSLASQAAIVQEQSADGQAFTDASASLVQQGIDDPSSIPDIVSGLQTMTNDLHNVTMAMNNLNIARCQHCDNMSAVTDMMKNGMNEELLAAIDKAFDGTSGLEDYERDTSMSAAAAKNAQALRAEDKANQMADAQLFADAAQKVNDLQAQLTRDMQEIMEKFNQMMMAAIMAERIGQMVDEHIHAMNWEKSIEQLSYHQGALQAVSERAEHFMDILTSAPDEASAAQAFLNEITIEGEGGEQVLDPSLQQGFGLINQMNASNDMNFFSNLSTEEQNMVIEAMAVATAYQSIVSINPESEFDVLSLDGVAERLAGASSVEINAIRRFDDDLIAMMTGERAAEMEARGITPTQFVMDPMMYDPMTFSLVQLP